ncbi:Hypothetical_protein [Hexamita inflata]|uniref:Hypothetical_protein n=1 Tax=Hexamita inflata TaxID=28002 RepID=A0AA86UDQ5_9EUKA|nr:Hypothetical protein HINF_LOCUS34727 [Hexamita inflata]
MMTEMSTAYLLLKSIAFKLTNLSVSFSTSGLRYHLVLSGSRQIASNFNDRFGPPSPSNSQNSCKSLLYLIDLRALESFGDHKNKLYATQSSIQWQIMQIRSRNQKFDKIFRKFLEKVSVTEMENQIQHRKYTKLGQICSHLQTPRPFLKTARVSVKGGCLNSRLCSKIGKN